MKALIFKILVLVILFNFFMLIVCTRQNNDIKLRSDRMNLYVNEIQEMIKKYNFFDMRWNKNGIGLKNKFKKEKVQNDKIVIDEAVGLMWQQSGSLEPMKYVEGENFVKSLNNKRNPI